MLGDTLFHMVIFWHGYSVTLRSSHLRFRKSRWSYHTSCFIGRYERFALDITFLYFRTFIYASHAIALGDVLLNKDIFKQYAFARRYYI